MVGSAGTGYRIEKWPYLALSGVPFEKLVRLELLLLVGDHPRHLEQEPRLGRRLLRLLLRMEHVAVVGRPAHHTVRVTAGVLGRRMVVPKREHVEGGGGGTVQHPQAVV